MASKADAEAKEVVSKIEVDFQKDKAAVEPAKAPVTEASVLAAIHLKSAVSVPTHKA